MKSDKEIFEEGLAEWRGAPVKKIPDHTQSLDQVVPELLKKLGLAERQQQSRILKEWNDIVGPFKGQAGTGGW